MSKILNSLDRLATGNYYCHYDKNLYCVRPVSSELRQRATLYYDRVLNSHRFEPVFRQKHFLAVCIRKGLLDKDYEQYIEDTKSKIEKLKINLFDSWGKNDQIKRIRKDLEVTKESLNKQYNYVSKLKSHTLEGFAEQMKNEYLFMNSIYCEDKKIEPDNYHNKRFFNHITFHYTKALLNDTELRAAARLPEWRQLWNLAGIKVFKNHPESFTPEQKVIIQFSEMYDFAYKGEKYLPSSLFEDDDRFDGWYLKQIKKMQDGRKKQAQEDNDAAEIYKVVDSHEQAKEIYDLNTSEARKAIQERQKTIKEKGVVRDIEFDDVKNELAMQAQQNIMSKFKK